MRSKISAISAAIFVIQLAALGSVSAAATADKRPAGYDFKPGSTTA